MKYLKKFSILESRGISNVSLIYLDIILPKFSSRIKRFVRSSEKSEEFVEMITKSNLTDKMANPEWWKMPVSTIEITFNFKKISNDEFSKKYPKTSKVYNFNATGACYNISDVNDGQSYIIKDGDQESIYLKMELGAIINEDKFTESNIEQLLIVIEGTLSHELNHAYESIQRKHSKKTNIPVELTHALDVNRSKIYKQIWTKWLDEIGYYIYSSELHEINASVQESWPYVKKYSPEEMMKLSPVWRIANEMENFNSNNFRKEIIKMINDRYKGSVDPLILLNRLKNGLANEMIESESKMIEGDQDKPSILGKKIKKMTLDRFFSVVEKRINLAGSKLKKKILKLYSLK